MAALAAEVATVAIGPYALIGERILIGFDLDITGSAGLEVTAEHFGTSAHDVVGVR